MPRCVVGLGLKAPASPVGIIEFGLLFAYHNEVLHSAGEGACYAAVSQPDYNRDVLEVTCDAIDLPRGR